MRTFTGTARLSDNAQPRMSMASAVELKISTASKFGGSVCVNASLTTGMRISTVVPASPGDPPQLRTRLPVRDVARIGIDIDKGQRKTYAVRRDGPRRYVVISKQNQGVEGPRCK